jgi:hypothetical protein
MFRAATSLAAFRLVTPPLLCATRATVNSNQIPSRRFTGAEGNPRLKLKAPRTFLPPNRPTETNNPSAADFCPAFGSSETHNQLGGATLCGVTRSAKTTSVTPHNLGRAHSVYVSHNPYGSAHHFARPCDLRTPRSIRRAPRLVAHAARIQFAGASLSGTIRFANPQPNPSRDFAPYPGFAIHELYGGQILSAASRRSETTQQTPQIFSPATPLRRSRFPAPGVLTWANGVARSRTGPPKSSLAVSTSPARPI